MSGEVNNLPIDDELAALQQVPGDSAAMLAKVQLLCGQAREQLAQLEATTAQLRQVQEAIIAHQRRLTSRPEWGDHRLSGDHAQPQLGAEAQQVL